MKKTSNYIQLPEEYTRRKLNSLYREIPLKDTTSRLLRKYFNAAANLYGIISLQKLYEIITSQNKDLITEKNFISFAEIARHECEDYYILGKSELYVDGPKTSLMEYEVIDISLLDEDLEAYHEILRGHQGKRYFVPDKKQLLAYDDPFYWEPTKEAAALRSFLLTRTTLEEEMLDVVFVDIYYGTHCMKAGIEEVLKRLNELGIAFRQNQDLNAFSEIYIAFHNNVRMQYNRGYTPSEASAMAAPAERMPEEISFGPNIRQAIAEGNLNPEELRRQVLAMDMPNEMMRFLLLKEIADAEKSGTPKKVKTGRNESCPCGSGKKFKHCCGR